MIDPTISQDAREYAARLAWDDGDVGTLQLRHDIREGKRDDHHTVRAFAHFEARLRTPASGEAGVMVERLLARKDDTCDEAADLITRLSTDAKAMRLFREEVAELASTEADPESLRGYTRGSVFTAKHILARIDALAKKGG